MSNAILLLYDITNNDSFNDTGFWCDSVRKHCAPNTQIFLVGNKADAKEKRVVSSKMATQYARQNKMHFLEVSAKDAASVEMLLTKITAYATEGGFRNKAARSESPVRPAGEKACVGCIIS